MSFLVLLEEVGSRKNDGLDCMITLMAVDKGVLEGAEAPPNISVT